MPNNIPNSTGYEHPNEPNLVNLHKAMEYNVNGEPHIRVKVDAGTVTVTEIDLGIVEIANDEGNPIPVSGTVSVNQPVAVTDNGGSLTVDGTVSVDNFPTTQTVDGTIAFSNTTIEVTQGTDPWTVDGTVSVDNFPATQTVDGTVTIQDGGNSITVDGSVSATVDGTVSVDNFPATQTVDGTVELGATSLSALENINATVSGTVTVDSITGNVTITDGGGSITVDGTVSVDNFPATQTVDGTVTIQDGGGSITVDGTVNATISGGTVEATIGGTNLDAFARLRVSNPVTLFDSQNRYIDGEQFSSDNSGSGSVTYNPNSSNFTLSVSGNGDEVIRQAKRVTLYQPGKSLLIMNTFAFNTPTTNLRQRVGYFTAQNGIFLEADGEDIYIVKRSYTSGSAVDTRIAQSNWNGDTLNGAGASGIVLDVSKTQIIWTDIEWLGVGSVRVGFVIDGVFHLAHSFHHANLETDVYMTTASLNCRYEITSTGASGSMLQICSTVISEGGYAPTPPIFSIGNGTAEKRLSSANTLYPLATIRLDPNYPDAVVVPAQIDFLSVDVKYGEVQLVVGATLTGASFNNSISSIVETDTSATAMTGGNTVFSALWASRSEIEFTEVIKKRLQLAREADGTPITLTFAAASNSGNTDILYKFGWEELSN